MALHIGILQCDRTNFDHIDQSCDYPELFARLFSLTDFNMTFSTYVCFNGETPEHPDRCDAWIITGSRHGCYENLDWMHELEDFIRLLYLRRIPTAGICFGHQLMAQALGGKVELSPKGWGLGIERISILQQKPWMQPFQKVLALPVCHQDQVTVLPDNAEIISGNDFCPYFLVYYPPCFLGIQGHPEFNKQHTEALINQRADALEAIRVKEAKDSLARPLDSKFFAYWLITFFLYRLEHDEQ